MEKKAEGAETEEPNVTERTHKQKGKGKAKSIHSKKQDICGMIEVVLVLKFRAVDVFEGRRAALLEVISVDYRGRVQRTTAPCNLPP